MNSYKEQKIKQFQKVVYDFKKAAKQTQKILKLLDKELQYDNQYKNLKKNPDLVYWLELTIEQSFYQCQRPINIENKNEKKDRNNKALKNIKELKKFLDYSFKYSFMNIFQIMQEDTIEAIFERMSPEKKAKYNRIIKESEYLKNFPCLTKKDFLELEHNDIRFFSLQEILTELETELGKTKFLQLRGEENKRQAKAFIKHFFLMLKDKDSYNCLQNLSHEYCRTILSIISSRFFNHEISAESIKKNYG